MLQLKSQERQLDVRATPHNRNDYEMQRHFESFLRSDRQFSERSTSRDHSLSAQKRSATPEINYIYDIEDMTMFDKNQSWFFQREQRLAEMRQQTINQQIKQQRAKPNVKPSKHYDPSTSHERYVKEVRGVDKFLTRSFIAHANREEQKLMRHNLGKSAELQITAKDVIKPDFAYQDIPPEHQPRISLLNPALDGS